MKSYFEHQAGKYGTTVDEIYKASAAGSDLFGKFGRTRRRRLRLCLRLRRMRLRLRGRRTMRKYSWRRLLDVLAVSLAVTGFLAFALQQFFYCVSVCHCSCPRFRNLFLFSLSPSYTK